MTAELRCQRCGRLLNFEHLDLDRPVCLTCGQAVLRANRPVSVSFEEDAPRPDHQPEGHDESEPYRPGVTASLAAAMPWTISALFHVSLGLILALLIILSPESRRTTPPLGESVNIPLTQAEGSRISSPTPEELEPTQPTPSDTRRSARERNDDVLENLREAPLRPAIGLSSSGPRGGRLARTGLKRDGGFYTINIGTPNWGHQDGDGTPAKPAKKVDVVYVLDRSGSMAMGGLFDRMNRELLRSLGSLSEPFHRYHVVYFGDGTKVENPARSLVDPTDQNLDATAEWLDEQSADGRTDPLAALRRAFAVLRTGGQRRGKVIFLLTDGVFPDNEAVAKLIARENRGKAVRIHTILLGGADASAATVMKQIASENNGRYKYVSGD
ncbi:MAG: vWA domain-containing protein [Phycisphaerae bacterium]